MSSSRQKRSQAPELTDDDKEVIMRNLRGLNKLKKTERMDTIASNIDLVRGLSALGFDEASSVAKKASERVQRFLEWYDSAKLEASKYVSNVDDTEEVLTEGSLDELTEQMVQLSNTYRKKNGESLQSYVRLLRQFEKWRHAIEEEGESKGLTKEQITALLVEECPDKFGFKLGTLDGDRTRILKVVNQYPRLLHSGSDKSQIKEFGGAFKKKMREEELEAVFWSTIPSAPDPDPILDLPTTVDMHLHFPALAIFFHMSNAYERFHPDRIPVGYDILSWVSWIHSLLSDTITGVILKNFSGGEITMQVTAEDLGNSRLIYMSLPDEPGRSPRRLMYHTPPQPTTSKPVAIHDNCDGRHMFLMELFADYLLERQETTAVAFGVDQKHIIRDRDVFMQRFHEVKDEL